MTTDLTRVPPPPMSLPEPLVLPDDDTALHELFVRIERAAAAGGMSQGPLLKAQLVGEELLVNSRSHATGGITCWLGVAGAGGVLVLVYEDNGAPYDPLLEVAHHLNWDLERRPVGGIGRPLICGLPCAVDYQRVGDHNRIVAVFREATAIATSTIST